MERTRLPDEAADHDAPAPLRQHLQCAIAQPFKFEQLGEDANLVNVIESRFVNARLPLDRQHDLPLAIERIVEGLNGLLASHKKRIDRCREGNEVSERNGWVGHRSRLTLCHRSLGVVAVVLE